MKNNPVNYPKIIKMISATVPTWAIYGEGTPDQIREQVVMWVLREDQDGFRHIDGMDAMGIHEGGYCEDASNFTRYTTAPERHSPTGY